MEKNRWNGSRVGGICGYQEIGGIIQNCKNFADVISRELNVGGICGRADGGDIISCINNGTISGVGYTGGICGYVIKLGNGSNALISKCENFGTVKGIDYKKIDGKEHGCIGGIAGGLDIGYKLEYCTNNGNIETSGNWVGGLTGDLKGDVVESINNASVEGAHYVGGLVGLIYESAVLKDSKNLGDVTGTSNFGKVYGGNLKTENDNVINCGENS